MIVAAVCAGTLGLAGCTNSEDGAPRPDPSSTGVPESSTGTTGVGEAPRVKHPLDASAVLPAPCSVLTPAQLNGFGVNATGVPDTDSAAAKAVGPACIWHPVDSAVAGSISVSWLAANKNGLSDTYRIRDRWSNFEETEVAGYPAAFTNDDDPAADGYCDITVGTSDSLTFIAGVKGSKERGEAVCEQTVSVAAAAIETLRGMQ